MLNEEHRKILHECRTCYYKGARIAGQAFTGYWCKECGGMYQHHNTATPVLCKDCALRLNVCRRCQNDINLF